MNFIEINSSACSGITTSTYAVDPSYFRIRMDFFADKYATEFKDWSAFYAAYSKKSLPCDNLDYEEWAFLCEQFLYEQTETSPPCDYLDAKERPESDSGLSTWGARFVRSRCIFC